MVIKTQSRDFIVDKLKRELLGPDPAGEELDLQSPINFQEKKATYKPFMQKGSREEILQRDSPLTRYGMGILYPQPVCEKKKQKSENNDPLKKVVFSDDREILVRETKSGNDLCGDSSATNEETSVVPDYLDLAGANKFLPNSMCVTFVAEIETGAQIIVNVLGGRYRTIPVKIEKEKRIWWGREVVQISAKFNDIESVFNPQKVKPAKIKLVNTEGLNLSVEVYARPTKITNQYLVTVSLVNRTTIIPGKMPDLFALFQSEFSVRVVSPKSNRLILPYRGEQENEELTDDEQSIDLLYRRARTYAIGHGCAADWDKEVAADEKVKEVIANSFPLFEVPLVTSDIKGADGFPLEISMAKLAGLVAGDDGMQDLREILDEYEKWINRRSTEILTLPVRYHNAAHRHLSECQGVLARMRDGFSFLQSNLQAREAFRLANRAILIQQHRSKMPLRDAGFNQKTGDTLFARKNIDPDLLSPGSRLGKWRAFQIAFLLIALRSTVDPYCTERETVDLIWFPTGGGKTEGYLSLAAFAIFYRRLINPEDAGTAAFMRYTLRLLTAQQFQRTGALICAMEILRRENPAALGEAEISIGLWLGNEATPGTRHDARQNLEQLQKHPQSTENKFILNRCPWCAAEIGKIEVRRAKKSGRQAERNFYILGYKKESGTVVLHCPDQTCRFYDRLPIYVTDEDIYEKRPTLFIATVDKLAVLAWKPNAQALFGLGKDGERQYSPPNLIIQDELHLISGPNGTMVALYEVLVEDLCTDRRENHITRPKIIASTATTRAYREQIKALFGRTQAQLFPPPGLDAGNSFFARYACDLEGKLMPGRLYLGVNAPGLKSLQNTEVRTYTALMQAANELPPADRNAYWTLMIFFNNLKSLGNTVSLFQANVQSYFLAYQNRTHLQKIRRIRNPIELTGQLRSDEVLAALKKLEVGWSDIDPWAAVDACLCSSIVEVGMDVPRLSLMTIISQPKTAAQYIQLSSRVGRDDNYPGLVVVIFSPNNARDRSHFEKFRSFHESLYAHVEPVSLTPFSPPALERALHAVMSAFIRQTGSRRQAVTPYPFPAEEIGNFKNLMLARLQKISPEMRVDFERVFNRRVNEWRRWEHTAWSPDPKSGNHEGLLRSFDKWADEQQKQRSWATPVSMRNVDTESELRITHFYQSIEDNN